MVEKSIKDEYRSGARNGITELDDYFYVKVRVTGSGLSIRKMEGEFVLADRPKASFFSKDAIEHYATLPIIIGHPKGNGGFLNTETLKTNPIVGNMISAWADGESEVWGVARIFDKSLLDKFDKDFFSTSPAVALFYDTIADKEVENPIDINHLAIVERGHWDTPDTLEGYSKGIDTSQYERIIMDNNQKQTDSVEEVVTDSIAQVEPSANVKDEELPVIPAADEPSVEIPTADEPSVEIPTADEPSVEIPTADEPSVEIPTADEVKTEVVDSVEEITADEAETEVVDSARETDEDTKRAEAIKDMRKACDNAHEFAGAVMPYISKRETFRSVVNRFARANASFVPPKYRYLATDSYTDELARDVLDGIFANISAKSKELGSKDVKGFVESGRGYSVDKEF